MYNLSYHVVVRTPVGVRIGDITLAIEDGKVTGVLETPFFEPSFVGILNEDDTLTLTLVLTANDEHREYKGVGRISGYAIHISVPTDDFTYEIDGTTVKAR